MNKRIILLIGATITSVIIIGLLIGNIGSGYYHDITFKTDKSGLTVELYGSDKKNIGSFTSSEYKKSLKDGDYYYAVKASGYDDSKIKFEVSGVAKDVNIKAVRSSGFLSSQYESQKDEILSVIRLTYKSTINNYDIIKGQLFGDGDWFGAIIKRKIDSRDITDLYRVILHKEDGAWVMIRYPEIVITKSNFPDIPSSVIDGVNNLSDQEV